MRALEAELIRGYREGLSARLPEYMVPSVFVLLERVPLTVNGKVDKKALPLPEGGGSEAVEYIEPRNEVEQALCDIWQEVLKQERVGVRDNFFSLGGDSILSIRVVSLLKARGVVISIKDIFQHQTVEQLAARARELGQAGVSQEVRLKLEPFALLTEAERQHVNAEGEYEDAYPMSALQAGMVFHTQLEQFSGIYHDIMAEHVKCPWERGSFERVLAACVEEHPMLRTGFRLEGERPLQLVHKRVELPLEVEDLRQRSGEEQEKYLREWTEERKRHVFEWERGPLFQVNIFLRTEESFEFVLSFHHAVLDGWSRAALTTELYNRYERLLRRRRSRGGGGGLDVPGVHRRGAGGAERSGGEGILWRHAGGCGVGAAAADGAQQWGAGGAKTGEDRSRIFPVIVGAVDRAGETAGSAGAGGAAGGALQGVVGGERLQSDGKLCDSQWTSRDSRRRAESGFVSELAANVGGGGPGELARVGPADQRNQHTEHGIPRLSAFADPAGR